MDLKRWSWVATVALLSLSGISTAGPARTLRAGDAVFWKGPFIEQASSSGGCAADSCWTYQLKVLESGYRLRIGLDHPEIGDAFSVDVFDPSGASAASFGTGTGLYSGESLHRNPAVGTWKIEVHADDVSQSGFRMRAKLEARAPRLGSKKGPVLPNLQILPPHEASFLTPITNGSQGDPPQGTEGPDSCHPEEHSNDGAIRCLRFAFGLRNTGRGPLQLWFEGSAPEDHMLFQRIAKANGKYVDREAGIARWHETHGHYHHNDAVELQLFRVTDQDTGTMESASGKHRKGFAHRDELLRDWEHFYPTWTPFGFGLLAGWSDIYEWDRPGNYIDFGTNGDGYYVVRMWADPGNGIVESNDRDNAGYTYFQVTGTDVELMEAGRGKHPWDPCKIEVGFGGHADPKRGPRPSHCPPDTT